MRMQDAQIRYASNVRKQKCRWFFPHYPEIDRGCERISDALSFLVPLRIHLFV
jgi:hypothetical protein